MTNIIASIISSKYFDYSKETKRFTQEISILQHLKINLFNKLYEAYVDEGFVMESAKTGNQIAFYLSDSDEDSLSADGEINYWLFKPIEEHVKKFNLSPFMCVKIYND